MLLLQSFDMDLLQPAAEAFLALICCHQVMKTSSFSSSVLTILVPLSFLIIKIPYLSKLSKQYDEVPVFNLFSFFCLDVLHGVGPQPSGTTDGPSRLSASFRRVQSAYSERHEIITGQIEQDTVQEEFGRVSWKCERFSLRQVKSVLPDPSK